MLSDLLNIQRNSLGYEDPHKGTGDWRIDGVACCCTSDSRKFLRKAQPSVCWLHMPLQRRWYHGDKRLPHLLQCRPNVQHQHRPYRWIPSLCWWIQRCGQQRHHSKRWERRSNLGWHKCNAHQLRPTWMDLRLASTQRRQRNGQRRHRSDASKW